MGPLGEPTLPRGERTAAARGADGGATEVVAETRSARFARKAHRTRLYVYAGVAVVLLVFLIALVLANTGRVKVSWVFGHSSGLAGLARALYRHPRPVAGHGPRGAVSLAHATAARLRGAVDDRCPSLVKGAP